MLKTRTITSQYLCFKGIDFVSFDVFLLVFGTVLSVLFFAFDFLYKYEMIEKIFTAAKLWKEILNIDGQQFHQC
jgi:uncharacterized membrane protein